MRDISEILASNWGFSGSGYWMVSDWCHSNSTTTDPGCHGNEIGEKNRLQLGLHARYHRHPCVYQGVFWVGLLHDASQILPRPSVVAMATKFELKLAMSRLILSTRSWRLSVCNKCARSTLDWSQSKIFLVAHLVTLVDNDVNAHVGYYTQRSKDTQQIKQRSNREMCKQSIKMHQLKA